MQEIDHKTNRTYSYIYTRPSSYEPLAQLEFAKNSENPTTCYYFHTDQIGVPRELTDEQGRLCWYGDYSGWGKLKSHYDLTEQKSIHQPFRLQNQYSDEETGLHYNFFRYYEPNVGRFTQLDPIGLAGGENLYRFADNVQGWIDPLGLNTYMCTRGLGQPSGTWAPPVFNHTYLCTGNKNGKMYCGSTTQKVASGVKHSWKPTASRPTNSSEDNYSASRCQSVSQDDCVEKCVTKKLKDPKTRNTYAIGPLGEDCQEYSSRILSECRKECGVEYEGLISPW